MNIKKEGERLFYQKGEPDATAVPASEIVEALLTQPRDIVISNGHPGVWIPKTTFEEISHLDPAKQLRIKALMYLALQHARKITLTARK